MSASMAPLYTGHTLLRAVIDAVLEGRGGRITVGKDVALLEWGCYYVPGGDASGPGAVDLLNSLRGPCEIVVPADDPWRARAEEVLGDRVRDRSMRSYVPGPELAARTAELAAAVPEGYALHPVTALLAERIGKDHEPHGVQVLGGPQRFVETGFGHVLVKDGGVACAATSYAATGKYVEVAIATHPDHRRRGLAACAASAMIGTALARGLEPHWNAFNPVSQHLADRLGFTLAGTCGILALDLEEDG